MNFAWLDLALLIVITIDHSIVLTQVAMTPFLMKAAESFSRLISAEDAFNFQHILEQHLK